MGCLYEPESIRLKKQGNIILFNFFKYILLLAFILFTGLFSVLWGMSEDLSYPTRRALQDYHLEWLKQSSQHGLKIRADICHSAATPCLFVEPDAQAGSANRGLVLRHQLQAAGVSLQPYGNTHGILVLLHGKNGRKEDLLPVAERFAAAGFQCVLPDMPAHGDNSESSAHYATSKTEQNFANRVLHDARKVFDNSDKKAGVWGMSMGGAFAIQAVSQAPENWHAMIIVASFDSLEGVIEDRLIQLPELSQKPLKAIFRGIVNYRNKLDINKPQPVKWATEIQLPVLVAHGTDDSLISIERGKHLFDAFSSEHKQWIPVPRGTHQNILVTRFPLYSEMSQWYLRFITR